MTRQSIHAVLIAIFTVTASATALAAKQEADKNLATVNGKPIPKSFADAMVAMQVARGVPDSEQLRKVAKDELVSREILRQEAQNQGFAKKLEVRNQMELASQNILINAYLEDYLHKHPIGEDTLKKEYEMVKTQMGDKEYKARHILIESEEAAKAIIARLDKGEKFEELAKQSKDPGSKDRGGDLGWAPPRNYVQPFAEALVKLQKGKYTAIPVKTNFGYHVILLEDTRALNAPSFEAIKAQLTKRLEGELIARRVAELRGLAKIE